MQRSRFDCIRLAFGRTLGAMKVIRAGLPAIMLLALVPAHAWSQTPASAPEPAFEVASIKKSQSQEAMGTIGPRPGGRVLGINIPPRALIFWSYNIRPYQIAGPDWIGMDRFDVEAKATGDATVDRLRAMMQTLLADRFHMAVHRETRETDGFALVRVRSDRLGPNLVPGTADCLASFASSSRCGENRYSQGNLTSVGMPLSFLAMSISGALAAPVLDQTQLAGTFDVALQWSPGSPEMAPSGDLPSMFTAVQEQLGLKLERTRVPVEVLVIDHIEHPTEN
jgi:uncharacterized protein (TIGR03435 family)